MTDPEIVVPPGALVVRGRVERGDQRGRTLGFPTANLPIDGTHLRDGVWAGWLDRSSGERHAAAISVGARTTFYGREGFRLLEAHVIGFEGDLYDELVTVWMGQRLRGQRRFAGVDALVAQLSADVAATAAWCSAAGWVPTPGRHDDLPVGSSLRLAI